MRGRPHASPGTTVRRSGPDKGDQCQWPKPYAMQALVKRVARLVIPLVG